jgi:transposase
LTRAQQRRLERVLRQGAFARGYPTDHWTLERIAQVSFQVFGVRYSLSGMWKLLQRLGWSNQKMTRVGLERDDAAIATWKARVWPRVKKVA